MRAIRIHAPGGPDAMRGDDIPRPTPAAGQALVRLEAVGVNFIDVYKRSGVYPAPLPFTLGEEGAGVVEAVGAGVDSVRAGDRVAYTSVAGAYAEYAAVAADRLVPVPGGLSSRDAAAAMLQGLTAHYLATSTYAIQRGDRCLVHAAAGGVGLLLVQMAKRRGAFVIGTAGTDEKAQLARDAGADEVIVYTRQDFVAEVRRITGGAGLHVVYDSVGKSTFAGGLELLAPRGLMALFGQSSGAVAPVDPQLLNREGSLYLTRPNLAHYIASRAELESRAAELFGWILGGELRLRVGHVFPLAEAAEAHRQLEGRQTTGKVVLVP